MCWLPVVPAVLDLCGLGTVVAGTGTDSFVTGRREWPQMALNSGLLVSVIPYLGEFWPRLAQSIL